MDLSTVYNGEEISNLSGAGLDPENPLIKALPPNTDHLTYLTILEYNLSKEQLPLLSKLLEDPSLTSQIGWDLVHLLLPLLPESRQCLHNISLYGNPRETILKVAEILEELGRESVSEDSDDSDSQNSAVEEEDHDNAADGQSHAGDLQFQTLLHMLPTLHSRIKTKRPSRFLLTSLNAIIPAYVRTQSKSTALKSILEFIAGLDSFRRSATSRAEKNPARLSSTSADQYPDPEAESETLPGEGDSELTLLRSFLTLITKEYLVSLSPVSSTSVFAWAPRYAEEKFPSARPHQVMLFSKLFESIEEFRERDALINQILSVTDRDLSMPWEQVMDWLIRTVSHAELDASLVIFSQDLEPSLIGVLCLIAAKLFNDQLRGDRLALHVKSFGSHDVLLNYFASEPHVAEELPHSIDPLLFLGWAALTINDGLEPPDNKDKFFEYLRTLSLWSINAPLPGLRKQAYRLCSAIFVAHPSSMARFDYIRDTLDHCPFEILRAVSVDWLKDEIVFSFNPNSRSAQTASLVESKDTLSATDDVFAQPDTIRDIWPRIFASDELISEGDLAEKLRFWLAAINLYYVLLSLQIVREKLKMQELFEEDVTRKFISNLRELVRQWKGRGSLPPMISENLSDVDMYALEDAVNRVDGLSQG